MSCSRYVAWFLISVCKRNKVIKSILNENETEVATKILASDCHFQTTWQHMKCNFIFLVRGPHLWKSRLQPSLLWDVILCSLVIFYRCFRTAYRVHLQGSSSSSLLDCLTAEDGTDRLSMTVYYWHVLCNILEEWRPQLHMAEAWNLQSRSFYYYFLTVL